MPAHGIRIPVELSEMLLCSPPPSTRKVMGANWNVAPVAKTLICEPHHEDRHSSAPTGLLTLHRVPHDLTWSSDAAVPRAVNSTNRTSEMRSEINGRRKQRRKVLFFYLTFKFGRAINSGHQGTPLAKATEMHSGSWTSPIFDLPSHTSPEFPISSH